MNYLDPDGLEVVVSDALALERIRSSVPAKLRNTITLTNSNRICENTLRRARTSNQNFNDLITLVSDTHLITVRTGTSSDLMEFTYRTQEQVRQELISIGDDPNKAIATIHLGVVNEISDNESEVILANNDGLLSNVPAIENAITAAHELYGHVMLRVLGLPWKHGDKGVDPFIKNVEDRTRADFE